MRVSTYVRLGGVGSRVIVFRLRDSDLIDSDRRCCPVLVMGFVSSRVWLLVRLNRHRCGWPIRYNA